MFWDLTAAWLQSSDFSFDFQAPTTAVSLKSEFVFSIYPTITNYYEQLKCVEGPFNNYVTLRGGVLAMRYGA